jgi:hypothetical protein
MRVKFLVVCLMVIVFLLAWFAVSNVEALNVNWPLTGSKTLCWNSTDWQNTPDHIIKLRVQSMGDNYHLFMSPMKTGLGTNLEATMGYARVIGTEIRMSVHVTHSDSQPVPTGDADQYGCQFFLNAETLNGTGWCSGTFYNPNDSGSGIDYQTGTLQRTKCQ